MAAPTLLEQYGVVGAIATIFATVIVFLFKQLREEAKARIEDHKKHADEQAKALVRDEALRNEYERKHREIVESYAKSLREVNERSLEREDLVRREFAELMETVSVKAAESSDAVVTVLSKFYDRFVGPRDRRGR